MSNDLAAMNRQATDAARVYMGHVAWPTILLTLALVGVAIGNFLLFAQGLTPWWVAALIYAALTYLGYTPLHEAVHDNISGRNSGWQWVNAACGYIGAQFITVAYSSHRPEHLTHHRYTNQPEHDPDYLCSNMNRGFFTCLLYVVLFLHGQNTFVLRRRPIPTRTKLIYGSEALIAIAWRTAFVLSAGEAWPAALAVLGVGYVLGAFFTAYWFAYRPHIPYRETARYRTTSSFFMPEWMKPVRWFWLGQDIHSIHHLFPRVPFYRYRALHREIEPVMRAHGTPMIGIYSRRPIPARNN